MVELLTRRRSLASGCLIIMHWSDFLCHFVLAAISLYCAFWKSNDVFAVFATCLYVPATPCPRTFIGSVYMDQRQFIEYASITRKFFCEWIQCVMNQYSIALFLGRQITQVMKRSKSWYYHRNPSLNPLSVYFIVCIELHSRQFYLTHSRVLSFCLILIQS